MIHPHYSYFIVVANYYIVINNRLNVISSISEKLISFVLKI